MKPCLTMAAALALAAAAFTPQAAYACRATETEPNNYDTSANTGACSGTAISGAISSSADYDWYRIDRRRSRRHQRQPRARQRHRP